MFVRCAFAGTKRPDTVHNTTNPELIAALIDEFIFDSLGGGNLFPATFAGNATLTRRVILLVIAADFFNCWSESLGGPRVFNAVYILCTDRAFHSAEFFSAFNEYQQIRYSLLQCAPIDEPVYQFMDKKRSEGKPYRVYMMASANKFLRIYYASVKAYLESLEHD